MKKNNELFQKYKDLSEKEEKVIVGAVLETIHITIWTRPFLQL
jgi:hypothetical protein